MNKLTLIIKTIRRLRAGYSLFGQARLFADFIYTRIRFPSARLVRRPIYIRGRNYIRLGRGLTTGIGNRIDAFPLSLSSQPILHIGKNVQINDYCHFAATEHLHIGDDCLIASRVFICDHNHGRFDSDAEEFAPDVPPAKRPEPSNPINIGQRVWIGEGVIILPGVTIGNGAVIGGGAVVTRNIPENCVAVGNPAKVIKQYDSLQRRWKKYEP
jgi:lipopolysaccharide O-acetyltransferase